MADFNGDHIPDLVYVPSTVLPVAGYYLAIGNGDGSFQTPTFVPAPSFEAPGDIDINQALAGMAVADFNHDGKPDLVYSFYDISYNTHLYTEGLAVQLGNGNGTFQPPVLATTYSSLNAPASAFSGMIAGVADVNKDNFPDVFLVVPTGVITNFELQHQVELFVGNGDGSFKPPAPLTLTGNMLPASIVSSPGFPIAVADLNGDGNVDLVAAGSSSDGTTPELAIALGNGDGTFQPATVLNVEGFGFVGAPTIADFDGDGKLDVYADGIFPGLGNGMLQTIVNGDSTVSAPENIALSVFGASVTADLNGDGKPDLIVGSVVLLNETGVSVTPPTTAATTTSLASSLDPSTVGQSVTLTATVTSTTAGTPTGTVTFANGGTALGTPVALNGQAKAAFVTSSLPDGANLITAQYNGDANFSASLSTSFTQNVNAATKAATTTAVMSSVNPSTSGQSVIFTATVTSATAGTPAGTATFFDGNTALGAAVTLNGQASATFTTSSLSTGAHSITAQYSGDANFAASTSSPALSQQVNAAAGQDFSVSANPTTLNLIAGQSGNILFTVTPINGSTQTVMFECEKLPKGTSCTFNHPSLTLDGTHTATSMLTFQTTGMGAVPVARERRTPVLPSFVYALLAIAAIVASWLTFASRRRLRPIFALTLVLILVAFGVVACSTSGGETPAGVFPIKIMVGAAGDSHVVQVNVNVAAP